MLKEKDLSQIFKDMAFYTISLLVIIFSYFILIRRTLYVPFITDAINTSSLSSILILVFFPFVVSFIPIAFKFFETKTPTVKKHSLIKISISLLITFILAISVDEIEALVSNRDTVVTTSNWMEPSIPVFAKDRDRGTNFTWLKISMTLFQISYITVELVDITHKIPEEDTVH